MKRKQRTTSDGLAIGRGISRCRVVVPGVGKIPSGSLAPLGQGASPLVLLAAPAQRQGFTILCG